METKLQEINLTYSLISTRFMESSLSNLVNNLSKGILKIKYKRQQDDKLVKLHTKYAVAFLNTDTLKMI